MKILHIGKHESGGNDDEGAITFALESLGHRVERLREKRVHVAHRMRDVDFILFHHCHDYGALEICRRPKVMWAFDLISYPDPMLERRNQQRRDWMRQVLPVIDVGFLTDGNFVEQDTSRKLHWLPQGADERVIGAGTATDADTHGRETIPLLFTGISRGGGQQRVEFVLEMQERYGDAFRHIQRGVYGRALADLIAASQIVVAPSGPVTDRYWSNRAVNVLGFGGFLLHPWSDGLAEMYPRGEGIAFYRGMANLHDQIHYYFANPDLRQRIAANGLARTRAEHTYRHRCAELIEIVKERLGL